MGRRPALFGIIFGFLIVTLRPLDASAVISLPDPSDTFDGIPVSVKYDEFVSYSAKLLTLWGFSGFDAPTGTGGLDVIAYTGPGGADNDPVLGGLFTFEDPAPAVSGGISSFTGIWGAGAQANGPVLVDDVLAYLQHQFGPTATTPVFSFDMNEGGDQGTVDLSMVAEVTIFDPATSTTLASWSFDSLANGVFDPSAYLVVPGNITVVGASTTVYSVDNNKGSGKADFLVFAPMMDLTTYAGQGYEFHAFAHLIDLDGGFEEIFISGAFAAPQQPPPTVP